MIRASLSPVARSAPRPGLLTHRLVYVSGKGGVGKSTVAASIGLAAAARGLRTVVAEVHRREDVAHTVRAGGADHVSIDPQDAMEEYLADQLPVRALAELLVSSRAFTYLAAATPGLRELLTAGKVWELAQDERRTPGAAPYDLVVVDAPATGHGAAVLAAPRTFAGAALVGPIARQGRIIDEMFSDPARTAVVAVATPEELAVNEALALDAALREQLGAAPALVVANAVRPRRLRETDVELLAAQPPHPAIAVALAGARRAVAAEGQLARLRAGAGDTPLVELPWVAGGPEPADLVAALEEVL